MNEKTTLLPTAPADERFVASVSPQEQDACSPECQAAAYLRQHQQPQTYISIPRIVLAPGLEFDTSRKFRYGHHALGAAVLVFLAFILIELRDCNWGFGTDLDKLQALHVSMLMFAFILYLLSLCGIADFLFKFKLFFFAGVITLYVIVGLMIWMTYEAAVNPCVKTFDLVPIDYNSLNKNVFSRGDGVGIVVLILDIIATMLMFSASLNFYKRY